MTLRMVDVETGALERSAVRDCECALQDILTGVVAQVAAELAGLAWTPPPSVSAQPLEVGEGVGILFVESTPAGGRIFINGRPSRETTPATLRNLPAGEHVVRVVREHLVAEERVRVVRDDLTKVSMPLQSGAGSLFIESDPPGADVRIDGTPRGTAPTLIREIPAGPHTISIHADDHLPWEEDIVIEFSRQTEIPVTLQPAGYVTLAVEPPDARVWLDDREISGNQRSRFAVAVGEHRVVARKVDYVPWGETIEIGRGETRRLNARLEWTQEYLQRVEAERQIAAAHRRATMKRTARWVSLGAAVVAGGLAYKYNSDAQSAYDEASEAHVGYRDATTTADAAIWRAQIVDADDRGDSAASKRNALFAVSGGLIGLGVTLCVF